MTLAAFFRKVRLPTELIDLAVTTVLARRPEAIQIEGWEILLNLALSYVDFGEYFRGQISPVSIRRTFRNRWTWQFASHPLTPEIQAAMESRYPERDWSPGYYLDFYDFQLALLVTEEELISLSWLTAGMLVRAPRFYSLNGNSRQGDGPRRSAKIRTAEGYLYSWAEVQRHFHPSYFLRVRLTPDADATLGRARFRVAELRERGMGTGGSLLGNVGT